MIYETETEIFDQAVVSSGITPHHAKFFAHELTGRQAGNGIERLTHSLVEAVVDLNPHQIEAALFALRSPLSKGVILADEVGLGKTIEAGLLLCQYWAEQKRRLLILCPASLCRQWSIELQEKFGLPNVILESRLWRQMERQDQSPLLQESAIIMSHHFARSQKDALKAVPWDLAVIDEAHKLRNLYKKDNKLGRAICEALQDRRKILLTATPLQNSLMELFGLGTLVDERIFGSEEAFRENYIGGKPDIEELKSRLKPFVHRTLRRDVLEYIRYTNREALTIPFTPSEAEDQLYNAISDFVARQGSYSIPIGQRNLVVLVIRKLLASSTYAIIGTLKTIKERLLALKQGEEPKGNIAGFLARDNELGAEYEEEAEILKPAPDKQKINPEKLEAELAEIEHYITLARAITTETKAVKLTQALDQGFARMRELGAKEKAIIFTESNRTQRYLKEYLEKQPGYEGQIVTFNGKNDDELARAIYAQWKEEHECTDRVTGARDVDLRLALVDHFRDHAKIMIATEAAAEGLNLQFCSLVVNYDLPWNPQRVEQRIGRCHRYGQQHDVVVINFLIEKNWADQRIFELLRDKFKLFDGVFGASDEILGQIEDGIDFEKRIATIFDTCRTPEEIKSAFDQLQAELEVPIAERLTKTSKILFEHFDEDVHQRLRLHREQAIARRNDMQDNFWALTKYVLIHCFSHAFIGRYHFNDDLRLFGTLKAEVESGHLPDKVNASFAYRLVNFNATDPHEDKSRLLLKDERQKLKLTPRIYKPSTELGRRVLAQAKSLETAPAHLIFDLSAYSAKISALESLKGKKGWLHVAELSSQSLENTSHLFCAACDEAGTIIPDEVARKLFRLTCKEMGERRSGSFDEFLREACEKEFQTFLRKQEQSNSDFFREEIEKLDKWAEDRRIALKAELKGMDDEIKELKRQARQTSNLPDQLALQKKIKQIEQKRDESWRDYDAAARDVEDKKDALIGNIEKRLKQSMQVTTLFSVSFEVV